MSKFDHLLPYETAARHLCVMRGEDPDVKVPVQNELIGVAELVPFWYGAAEELLEFSQCFVALQMARQQPTSPANMAGANGGPDDKGH